MAQISGEREWIGRIPVKRSKHMRKITLRLDRNLLAAVDRLARHLQMTRSAFARKALREAVARVEKAELEWNHRRGYGKQPVREGEFDVWEEEQAWGEW